MVEPPLLRVEPVFGVCRDPARERLADACAGHGRAVEGRVDVQQPLVRLGETGLERAEGDEAGQARDQAAAARAGDEHREAAERFAGRKRMPVQRQPRFARDEQDDRVDRALNERARDTRRGIVLRAAGIERPAHLRQRLGGVATERTKALGLLCGEGPPSRLDRSANVACPGKRRVGSSAFPKRERSVAHVCPRKHAERRAERAELFDLEPRSLVHGGYDLVAIAPHNHVRDANLLNRSDMRASPAGIPRDVPRPAQHECVEPFRVEKRQHTAPLLGQLGTGLHLQGAGWALQVGPWVTGLPPRHSTLSSQSTRPGATEPTFPGTQAW